MQEHSVLGRLECPFLIYLPIGKVQTPGFHDGVAEVETEASLPKELSPTVFYFGCMDWGWGCGAQLSAAYKLQVGGCGQGNPWVLCYCEPGLMVPLSALLLLTVEQSARGAAPSPCPPSHASYHVQQ